MSQATTLPKRKHSNRRGASGRRDSQKKEIFMKRTIAAIALFVASIFITAGVWAQSLNATIPFDFTINNNTVVPAGTYSITSALSTDHHVLSISDHKNTYLLSSALPNAASGDNANVLVFHRYGNQYFLSQIRSEITGMNLRLPVWNAEKKAMTHMPVATLPTSSNVTVATK
jgi:hypothetical protein